MPDICPKKKKSACFFFLMMEAFQVHVMIISLHPIFTRISIIHSLGILFHPPYLGDILSDAWKSKWYITQLESWKHQGHQSNMTKTWQKNRKYFESRKMKLAKNLCFFVMFFCHFPVIFLSLSLCFSIIFSFSIALKQQNHWQINQNQRKNKENIWQ